jgi:ABC-type bacteriocin/lantibiotic exporter with double-glycine peptidase domain
MSRLKFLPTLKRISLKKSYIIFSIFYGLSSLIIPFATQFMVNNLALSGIWINTVTFLVIIAIGLILSQTFRYCQVIITEYMQRELFVIEMERWQSKGHSSHSHYYFEVIKILKTYSKSFTSIVEIGLIFIFGVITIMIFHPAFVFLTILLYAFLHWIFTSTKPAIETSIQESNRKYDIFYTIDSDNQTDDKSIDRYLEARQTHFFYIKRNALLVGIVYVLGQFYLLGVGLYLVQDNQLSVGQLVSAEIILSGILASLLKLPQTMEDLYDYETSEYKINKALSLEQHDE